MSDFRDALSWLLVIVAFLMWAIFGYAAETVTGRMLALVVLVLIAIALRVG